MRLAARLKALAVACLVASSAAVAQGPGVPPPSASNRQAAAPAVSLHDTGAHALTAADAEAWLDGFMSVTLPRSDIAGAVAVVVKDGRVLVEKGYGYSNVEKRTPVDPQRTLFRPGSISKLFTWTAVMQQVERGRIDLDADVNRYLDFKIPPGPGGKPVTMRDIMTHTAGFEEAIKGLILFDPKSMAPLGEVLKHWTPERIFEAGTTPAYSNYATALAGYIVERTSRMSFDDYVERNILQPLGMTHTTFRGPLPANLRNDMSQGYELASGKPKPFEFLPLRPAGMASTTGADMARFMIAHLQQGAYGDARILRPETARMMHDTVRTVLPPLNSMALGFYETSINGRRVISHGGDTRFFHSYLHLWLNDGVGLFVSFNSAGKDRASNSALTALYRQFADRYLPGPTPDGRVDQKVAAEHARMIAGAYSNSRRSQSNLFSILDLIGGVKVIANPDNTISVSLLRGLNGELAKFREIAPFVWIEEGGKDRLVAQVVDGKVVRFGVDFAPFMVFDRTPLASSSTWLRPAVIASLAAILVTVILWPVGALVRRHYGKPFPLKAREASAWRWVRIGAGLSALVVIAWGATVLAVLTDLNLGVPANDWWLLTLHILGSLAVFAGFALALWNAWEAWKGRRGWFSKLWSVVLVIATFILAWIAVIFHLVGLSTNY